MQLELSLRAAIAICHTQHGGDLDPRPISVSGAELGHFLSGCLGVPWKLRTWVVSAPFLFRVLVSAPAQPGSVAPRPCPQQRLVCEKGMEGKGHPGVRGGRRGRGEGGRCLGSRSSKCVLKTYPRTGSYWAVGSGRCNVWAETVISVARTSSPYNVHGPPQPEKRFLFL